MNVYLLLLAGLGIVVILLFFLQYFNSLRVVEDRIHPTKKGWRITRITNKFISGDYEYKREKEKTTKGRTSLTFYDEQGEKEAYWNTHGYDDYKDIHYHTQENFRKEKNFKKSPSISTSYLKKIDKMDLQQLRKERKKYE